MSLKGMQLRAALEDIDLLVFIDGSTPRGLVVKYPNGANLARYDLHEDGAFRFGYVEHVGGAGRTDCLDWPTFLALLQERINR